MSFCKNDISESLKKEVLSRLNNGQSIEQINNDFKEEIVKENFSNTENNIINETLKEIIDKNQNERENFIQSKLKEISELRTYKLYERLSYIIYNTNILNRKKDLEKLISKDFSYIDNFIDLDLNTKFTGLSVPSKYDKKQNKEIIATIKTIKKELPDTFKEIEEDLESLDLYHGIEYIEQYEQKADEINEKLKEEKLKLKEILFNIPNDKNNYLIEPSEELIDKYWEVNKPEEEVENIEIENEEPSEKSLTEIAEDFENTKQIIEQKFPDVEVFQNNESFDKLSEISYEINETYPNIVSGISINPEHPSDIKIHLHHAEAIPEDLQKQLVNKSYTAEEVGRITLNKTLEKLHKVFPELRFEFINPLDLNQADHNIPTSEIKSFIKGNTVYLVEGKFDKNSTIDEFLHPFTYGLFLKNKELFNNLFEQNKDKFSEVYNHYKSIGEDEAQIEVVNRAIQSGLETQPSLLQQFYNFIKKVLQKLFPFSTTEIASKDISAKLKVEDLSKMLLNGGYKFEHYYTQQPYYNALSFDEQKQDKIVKALQANAKDHNVNKVGKDEGYEANGTPVARTSDLVAKRRDEIFKNSPFAQQQQIQNLLDAEDGTAVHAVIEDVFDRYFDKASGYKKTTPSDVKNLNGLSEKIYDKVEKYVLELTASYDRVYGENKTRFLWETVMLNPAKSALVKIKDKDGNIIKTEYRKGVASTIDFMAVLPTGKINILDWKTIAADQNTELDEHFKNWKKTLWEEQLASYIDTVKQATSLTDKDFEVVRIVPFIRKYETNRVTKEKELLTVLTPSVDVKQTDVAKLKPFISQREYIQDKSIENFINKVRSIIKIQEEKNKLEGIRTKFKQDDEFISEVENAIADFRLSESLEGLYDLHAKIVAEAEKALNELLAIPAADFSNTDKLFQQLDNIYELISAVNMFKVAAQSVYGDEINQEVDKDHREEEIKFQNNIRALTDKIELLSKKHNQAELHIASVTAKTDARIADLSQVEKKVGAFDANATTLAVARTRTAKYYAKKLSEAWPKLQLIVQGKLNKTKALLHSLSKEQGDVEKAFKKLLDIDKDGKWNGKLKNRIKQDYWNDRKKVLEGKDLKKLQEFYSKYHDFERIKKDFKQKLEDALKEIEQADYSGIEEKFKKAKKKQEIEKANRKYNLEKNPEAYTNIHYGILETSEEFKKNYHEDWYKGLSKSLLDTYNHFQNINLQLAEEGEIDWKDRFTFVPNFEKTTAEKGLNILSNVKGKLQVTPNSGLYGAVNHATGESIEKINVMGVSDYFDGDYKRKSIDLFRSYDLLMQDFERAKVVKKLDPLAKTLLRIEKNKQVYDTNWKGDIKEELGNKGTKMSPVNSDANYNYFKQFIDSNQYSKKIQQGWDYQWNTTDKKTGETKTYSVASIVNFGTSAMYLKSFALNVFTPLRVAASGFINNKLLGDKHFLPSQMKAGKSIITYLAHEGNKESKLAAALGYFMPFISNEFRRQVEHHSMNKLTSWTALDNLNRLMSDADMVIQTEVANALLENAIVIDGDLVNVRQYSRTLPDFNNMYLDLKDNIPELKKREKLFEAKVKELIKEKGVLANSEVKDNEFIINGLTKENKDKAISRFVNLAQYYNQRVTGMNPEWNRMNYKNSTYFGLFAPYRNWIPNLVGARFGEFEYNAQIDDYQWGKHLSLWDSVRKSFKHDMKKTLPILLGFGIKKDLMNYAALKYQELKEKMDYEGRIVTEEFMDKNEFVRMYLNNIDNTVKELRVIAGLFAVVATLPLLASGGAPDDKKKNALIKFARFQSDRLLDEFSFYYSPSSVTDIVKGIVPLVSYTQDLYKGLKNIPQIPFADEPWVKVKNAIKPFPVTSELIKLMPLINSDIAKEMRINVAVSNNFIK